LTSNALPPYANSKPDLWIFNQMAKRFDNGKVIHFPEKAEQVFEEMKFLSKGPGRTLDISGMSYQKIIAARGIQWPYRQGSEGLKGEPRLYTDGHFQTKTGKANLIPVKFYNNNEQPCNDYPFWLNS